MFLEEKIRENPEKMQNARKKEKKKNDMEN